MGDRGTEHTTSTELEKITSRISDLSKWREIFSFRGLEINNTAHQRGRGSAGDGAAGAGEPPEPQPPSIIPQPLPPGTDGHPLPRDTAMRLQKLLFGDTTHGFSFEWAAGHFRFHRPHSDLAYALQAGKVGTRAVLMAVQAHIITYLLFERDTEYTHLERLCRIGQREQEQALAMALAETLWAAGGGGRAIVCLVSTAVTVVPRGGHRADTFTERIQLFEFTEKRAAQEFISDHINCFKCEGGHGVILFLYSLLFSRTLERVQEDLGDTAPLLNVSSGNITCTEALLSLLLTGRASPEELEGVRERRGQRSPVGFLRWERAREERQVSPALRTPRRPVWLCSIPGRLGVLFGTDSRLLSHWRAETAFHLHFYSGQREQTQTAHLRIDTHSHHWEDAPSEDPCSPGKRCPALEMAIRTKWAGATISWNGTEPFF